MAARKKMDTEKTLERIKGTVTGGTLNIREKAGLEYEIVGRLENGAKIEILEAGEEWHRIEGGYVMAKWVELDA